MAPCLSNSWDSSLFNKNRKLCQHQDKTSNNFVNLCSLCQTLILTGRPIFSGKQEEVTVQFPEEVLKSFLNPINNQVSQCNK